MVIGVLVFVRYDSSRLPGKALKKIHNRELLGRVLDRASRIMEVDGVVVATTDRAVDDAVSEYAEAEGFDVYRGATENVAGRALKACEKFGWDAFVRICGDRPFFDVSIVDNAVRCLIKEESDLVSTSGKFPLPPGLTTEVVSVNALKKHLPQFSDFNKEHLTSFFYENCSSFNISYQDYASLSTHNYNTRLVVDDDSDYSRAEWIASKLTSKSDVEEVLKLACKYDAMNESI